MNTPQSLWLAATPQSLGLAATPQLLWLAAQRGQTGMIDEWLQNWDNTQDGGRTLETVAHLKLALRVAVTNNHEHTISCVMKKWRVGTDTIMLCLGQAIMCGCVDAMRALFAHIGIFGISIACKRELLLRAIDETRPEIIAYLAQEQDVDLNQRLTTFDYEYSFIRTIYNPLTLAVRHACIAALGINSGQKKHAGRRIATVEALLRYKACVNNLEDTRSPLMVVLKDMPHATPNRHIRHLLRTLVRAKADVDALSSREKEMVVVCCGIAE